MTAASFNSKNKTFNCLSVVISAYNEQDNIIPLYRKLKRNLVSLQKKHFYNNYEIFFINDGSTDQTKNRIETLCLKDKHVKIISLRKNFGKSTALQTGFHYTKGDVIITLDADMQDDPDEISRFITKIQEGYDIVSGWKINRLDPLEKRIMSKIFNFITRKLSGIRLHDCNCGFKAYRRDVINALYIYGEFHRYIPLLASRNGFSICEIPITHHKRLSGKSKFGTERYLRGMFDAISVIFLLKFYDKPMYFFGKIGLFLFTIGFAICSYLTALWFSGHSIGSRPLLILGVLFLLIGFQSFSIGLIANLIIDNIPQSNKNKFINQIVTKKNNDE
ncbi:MAG: glycosyltransferase family 2 protein [Alphaproteobacteria bacterium]|nr:glycosyltransferase family 2 protein [Alphaproteobacteria bacterium]